MALEMDIAQLEAFIETDFPQAHGLYRVLELGEDRARIAFSPAESHLRPGGTISGPSLFSLADIGVYLTLLAMIGPQALAVTTNASMDFMRKPKPGRDLVADITLLKRGRVLAVGDVLIRSEGNDDVVARATLTYSIPPARR